MLLAAGLMAATFVPAIANAQPAPTIQSERAAHPNIVHAIQALQTALADLERAPYDFGGNKVQAMDKTRQAIHSLKKALYYRLNMDDAAIDAAQ
jgi:hypothetical protein